jgi:hypothetical protein
MCNIAVMYPPKLFLQEQYVAKKVCAQKITKIMLGVIVEGMIQKMI